MRPPEVGAATGGGQVIRRRTRARARERRGRWHEEGDDQGEGDVRLTRQAHWAERGGGAGRGNARGL